MPVQVLLELAAIRLNMRFLEVGTSVTPLRINSPRFDQLSACSEIESAKGDGVCLGLVKVGQTKPFTLKDPDANIVYETMAVFWL